MSETTSHAPARRDEFGQPIGPALAGWSVPPAVRAEGLEGRTVRLVPLDAAAHAAALFAEHAADADARAWTYLPYGPFESAEAYAEWMRAITSTEDPQLFAVFRGDDTRPSGALGYLRILPELGSVEVGHVHFGPRLRRTVAATEALVLLMRHAFGRGYRRYEWKCDALNAPSRAAALRLGFRFEGTFRNSMVTKGRNRDTAWFSITDAEFARLDPAFERWLAPANFDAEGAQRSALSDLVAEAVGPAAEREERP